MSLEVRFKVWCRDKLEFEKHTCLLSQDGVILHERRGGGFFPLKPENHDIILFTKERGTTMTTITKDFSTGECCLEEVGEPTKFPDAIQLQAENEALRAENKRLQEALDAIGQQLLNTIMGVKPGSPR